MSQGFRRAVGARLEEGGRQARQGDHDVWINPRTGQTIAVPVKIKSRHTANGLVKEAGLDKAF
jgi:hypothetical protein